MYNPQHNQASRVEAALSLAALASGNDMFPPMLPTNSVNVPPLSVGCPPILSVRSPTDEEQLPASELHFQKSGNCYRVIFAMAVGLKDPSTNECIAKFTNDPMFTKRKDRKKFKPTLNDLVQEVVRRKKLSGDKSKTQKQGVKDKFITMLDKTRLPNLKMLLL